MMTPLSGIDAPDTVAAGTSSFEVTVSTGASSVFVTVDPPPSGWTAEVGDDGKVTITVPPGVKDGAAIIITDDRNPPASAYVEVVSSS